jgi:proteasome lid subunit RPN8/RPN11
VGSESLWSPRLQDEALHRIIALGRARSPAEACGLLLIDDSSPDQRVIELPNRSDTPHTSYMFTGDDIMIALENSRIAADDVEIGIWHTHPGGRVGPSTEDQMKKLDGVPFLVVTLLDDNTTITDWF